MIIEVEADLLVYPLDGFMHQTNCFHTMGSGIAKAIREKYPELYKADCEHGRRGAMTTLGTFSTCKLHDDKQGYNAYGQFNFGGWKRNTNYEAVYTAMLGIKDHATANNILKLGLPKMMGCKLGGGSWYVYRAIIEDIFGQWENELYICDHQVT